MIKAVIFDMDGLLLDSELYWDEARHGYVQQQGGAWSNQDSVNVIGHNSAQWARYIQEQFGIQQPAAEIIQAVVARMEQLYAQELPWLPGAQDAVRLLAGRYPLAVASASHRTLIDLVLNVSGLGLFFQSVTSADEVTHGKPAPDVYLLAASRLGVAATACVAFEDSSNGILSAAASGAQVVAVPNLHFPPTAVALAQATLVLPSLAQLTLAMVEGIGG